MSKPKVVAIVGPTASGKTSLSIEIAKKFNGEVISADSRQIYRGLDIGTGKVTIEEMDGIPHHLLDVAELADIYTGADFLRNASDALEDILNRHHLPIVAGGTFFYLDLLRGKMQPAPVEPNLKLRAELDTFSTDELLSRLANTDAKRAKTIDTENRRRIIRAIEIAEALGSVPEPQEVESDYEWLILGIKLEKEVLQNKLRERLTKWLEAGLLNEVKHIRNTVSEHRFSELGFEYTLSADYIDGNYTEEEFFQKFVEKNWRYAKRQMTWLKRDQNIVWVNPSETEAVLERVNTFIHSNT